MKRKITFNIIGAILFVPLIEFTSRNFTDILSGKVDGSTLLFGLKSIFKFSWYGVYDLLFLVIVLIPFQLIKDYNWRRGKKRSFWWKWVVVSGLFAIPIFIMWIMVPFMWFTKYGNSIYLILCLASGFIINIFFYFTVDKYVEKKEPYDNRWIKLTSATWRKIILNFVAAIIFVPLFNSVETFFYFGDFINSDNISDLPFALFKRFFWFEKYGLQEVIFIVVALLPFQLIKDKGQKDGRIRPFWWHYLVLTGIIFIVLMGRWLFTSYMHRSYAVLYYTGLGLTTGLLLNTFLYFTIDRHVSN